VGFLVSDIREFQRESAADYVSLDPELADISQNEPTLMWIVMDIALLGLDVAAMTKMIRPLARALTATRSAEDFIIFARGARAALPEAAAETLIQRASRRFGVTAPAEAIEIRVSGTEYLRALEHVFPHQYFDEALRAVDDIGRTAARNVVRNPAFLEAVRRRNWALAGTYFHSAAAAEGRLAAQAGRLPAGWRFEFELVVQSGKGGSRLDVFLRGPAGEVLELDCKTTGRSALSTGSRREMARHATQIADPKNLGLTLTGQRSVSWVDEARVAWDELVRTDPTLAQQLFGGPANRSSIIWPR